MINIIIIARTKETSQQITVIINRVKFNRRVYIELQPYRHEDSKCEHNDQNHYPKAKLVQSQWFYNTRPSYTKQNPIIIIPIITIIMIFCILVLVLFSILSHVLNTAH